MTRGSIHTYPGHEDRQAHYMSHKIHTMLNHIDRTVLVGENREGGGVARRFVYTGNIRWGGQAAQPLAWDNSAQATQDRIPVNGEGKERDNAPLVMQDTRTNNGYKRNSFPSTRKVINFFTAYGLGLRPLSNPYIYVMGLNLRPSYIFSLDKDSM